MTAELALNFTKAELRVLLEKVMPYPQLGDIRLACQCALLGRADMRQCTRLQAAVEALRAQGVEA